MAEKRFRTSIKITNALWLLEGEIVKETRLTKDAYHYWAIKHFLDGDQKVDDRLKVSKKSPFRINKPLTVNILLDYDQLDALKEVARREGCGFTVVIFQAILNYSLQFVEEGKVDRKVLNQILTMGDDMKE